MKHCIYCQKVMLAEGEEGDHKLSPSREHIIPAALGGPNALCTFDVCKSCNSTLGKTTDGNLMKEQFISIIRQRFGLSGYSGKIPDVVFEATSIQTGVDYRMRVSPIGDVSYDTRPVVKKRANPDGSGRVQISGSSKQVAEIMDGMSAKLSSNGQKMLNPDGSEISSVEGSVKAAQVQRTTEFKTKLIFKQIVVQRSIIKIAFGFAHLVLGPGWTFSPHAKPLRDAALGLGNDAGVEALVSGLDRRFCDLLLRSEAESETRHVIALLSTGEQKMIAVSLFGEALLTMVVRLEATDGQYEEGIIAQNRVMVSALASGDDIQWLNLEEFTRRIAEVSRPFIERSR